MLIAPLTDVADISAMLDLVDGLVMSGCNLDLDLTKQGYDPHPALRPMPARRESFERTICKMAVNRKLPILAIGSGMQLLNQVCGGTLWRHIPEDILNPLQHRHPLDPHLGHLIEIKEDTLLYELYGPGEIRVNSQHHMAVKELATCFQVSAICSDGVIEAYESNTEKWFAMGVQWHPENDNSTLDMKMFNAFILACDNIRRGANVALPFLKLTSQEIGATHI